MPNNIILRSYLNLILVIACSKMWFGLLCSIHYFVIFCKIVKTATAYTKSSFLTRLRLQDFKN